MGELLKIRSEVETKSRSEAGSYFGNLNRHLKSEPQKGHKQSRDRVCVLDFGPALGAHFEPGISLLFLGADAFALPSTGYPAELLAP